MSDTTQRYNTKSAEVNWDGLEQDVVTRLRLLRAAWEASERDTAPEAHAKLVHDLYVPAIMVLGEFCACVDVEDDSDGEEADS